MERITDWYFSDRRRLTTWSAKLRPSTRASQNTSREPTNTAAQVSRKAVHIPKSTPPARAVMLLGMGASTTESSCSRKNHSWA